jgi:hypothetical protein
MLTSPEHCTSCTKLHRLTVTRLKVKWSKVPVLSWCRICGLPVLLEVVRDYEYARRNFYVLDDQPQAHKNVHAERGGWGMHWRLDDVLTVVFGDEHAEVCWPLAPWYEHNESMDLKVQIMSEEDVEQFATRRIDIELRMLQSWINGKPRTREEIQEQLRANPVWDAREFMEAFEVLGWKSPFVIAVNKQTGERGSLLFQHEPRFYFSFDPDRVI